MTPWLSGSPIMQKVLPLPVCPYACPIGLQRWQGVTVSLEACKTTTPAIEGSISPHHPPPLLSPKYQTRAQGDPPEWCRCSLVAPSGGWALQHPWTIPASSPRSTARTQAPTGHAVQIPKTSTVNTARKCRVPTKPNNVATLQCGGQYTNQVMGEREKGGGACGVFGVRVLGSSSNKQPERKK